MIRFWKGLFGPRDLSDIDIVAAYGAVLERATPGAAGTYSIGELPFRKDIISAAIVRVASSGSMEAAQLDALHAGFLQLSAFQGDGGGRSPFLDADPAELADPAKFMKFIKATKEPLQQDQELSRTAQEEMKKLELQWQREVALHA